jgi:hypothetical protein
MLTTQEIKQWGQDAQNLLLTLPSEGLAQLKRQLRRTIALSAELQRKDKEAKVEDKMKLDIQHKHIMKLIDRDKKEDGWASVSNQLYPHLCKNMPAELVELCGEPDSFKARLTKKGENILEALAWI